MKRHSALLTHLIILTGILQVIDDLNYIDTHVKKKNTYLTKLCN